MKVEIPQIIWHGNKQRIMSIDFFPNSEYFISAGPEDEEKLFIKVRTRLTNYLSVNQRKRRHFFQFLNFYIVITILVLENRRREGKKQETEQ